MDTDHHTPAHFWDWDGKFTVGIEIDKGWTGFRTTPGDARRIVACVKACEGIGVKALESGELTRLVAASVNMHKWMEKSTTEDFKLGKDKLEREELAKALHALLGEA